MFAGVFPPESRLHAAIYPLRRELSIMGCILASGHIIAYLDAFVPWFLYPGGLTQTPLSVTVSLAVSLVLTVLLAVLTVTSFVVVRSRMRPALWKRIQSLAYPFYMLILLHCLLILLPSALAGSITIAINLAVYAAVFCAYVVLRIRRVIDDR
jgi:DMSO/TMAO reductase YedYZ heme-binding membrane subunit